MNIISREYLKKAIDYSAYRQLTQELLAQNRTTGPDQSEHMVHYTLLNETRMKRLDKTTRLSPELTLALAALESPQIWLTITEPWCGDASQIVPVLAQLAEASEGKVELLLLLRDEHPELMDAFLTNGGRAIPKVIILNREDLKVLGNWGPRPTKAQALVNAWKAEKLAGKEVKSYQDFVVELQNWYNADQTQEIQREVVAAALVGFAQES